MERKLYIDMIAFYLQKAGGITSVWKELLIRMLRDKKDLVLILQNCECTNIYFEQIMSFKPAVIYDMANNIKLNRYLPIRCKLEDESCFISTYYRVVNNKSIKQYTIVHDFTYEYYVNGMRKWVHSWQKRTSVKHADTIICVSQNTMEDLIKFYPWAKDKKRYVIYNGVSETYKKINEEIYIEELGKYNYYDFFLYIGSRAKYKRFDFAVDVAKYIGYPLVIVGGGELSEQERMYLEDSPKVGYVHIKGIQDATLNKIYNKAFALLYPSEYEGFGIPILEAQRAGCPVIARKGSSINEVFGNDKYLLNNNTVQEVGSFLEDLKNEKLNKMIRSEGIKNSERFDWEKMYKQYEDLFQ